MKHFSRSSHNLKKQSRQIGGTPDRIYYSKDREFYFEDDCARAFIYFVSANVIIWSRPGGIHNEILFDMDFDEKEKLGIPGVFFVDELLEAKDVRTGRIWVTNNKSGSSRKYDVYIAWWEILSNSEFNKFNKHIISEYKKEFKTDISTAMIVDNNGDFVLFNGSKYIDIEKNDKERERDLFILKQIHLASEDEKRKYLSDFLKNRGKNKQEMFYNKTKSKTAAEYNYIKTIGDSLEEPLNKSNRKMKSLYNFILERQRVSFGGTGAKIDNYGSAVILAGGPGSGKGFIQSKIDGNFRIFNVDDLKKLYVNMVDAGKIDDPKHYDFKNPDDVSELHQKVKDRDWKNKQREAFFKAIKTRDKHSSSELSNILFDMVSGKPEDVEEIAGACKEMGYKVTVVWVLCNKETAKIGNKIRDREVHEKVIDDGHDGAFKTMSAIFANEYPEISKNIDAAWIGFSAGYGRMLLPKYTENPVIKIKKPSQEKFNIDQSEINDFLKDKMPIDYKEIESKLKSKDPDKRKQCEEWIKLVGDEYQPNNVSEHQDNNYELISSKLDEFIKEIL